MRKEEEGEEEEEEEGRDERRDQHQQRPEWRLLVSALKDRQI